MKVKLTERQFQLVENIIKEGNEPFDGVDGDPENITGTSTVY